MSEPERNKLASGLTTIRHEVKNPVIVFMNIHYSKALEKFFRDTDFKIVTSISDEEMDNFQKLFGYKNAMKLHRFTRMYRSMLLRKQFKIGKYTYHTHKPFRIALISELGKLHGTLYYRDGCNKCVKDFHGRKCLQGISLINCSQKMAGTRHGHACGGTCISTRIGPVQLKAGHVPCSIR